MEVLWFVHLLYNMLVNFIVVLVPFSVWIWIWTIFTLFDVKVEVAIIFFVIHTVALGDPCVSGV